MIAHLTLFVLPQSRDLRVDLSMEKAEKRKERKESRLDVVDLGNLSTEKYISLIESEDASSS